MGSERKKELVNKAWMEILGSKVAPTAAYTQNSLQVPEVANPVIKANMLV